MLDYSTIPRAILGKWLTKTYASFGTTKDYVRMLEDTGFEKVSAKLIFPGMATIWQGHSPETE